MEGQSGTGSGTRDLRQRQRQDETCKDLNEVILFDLHYNHARNLRIGSISCLSTTRLLSSSSLPVPRVSTAFVTICADDHPGRA